MWAIVWSSGYYLLELKALRDSSRSVCRFSLNKLWEEGKYPLYMTNQQSIIEAGIGEIVHPDTINGMCMIIDTHGEEAFRDLVWNEVFGGVAYAYIHPCDAMRCTRHFHTIQRAFINAYV